MKKIFYFAASALMMCSCADSFLSEEPVGEFLPGQVESEENIEGIVTGAYAVLDGYYASDAINSGCSNWQFGDVVSDDAYKGGGGTGDQNQIHLMEIFNANPTGIDFEARWAALYEGIKRCNQAIRLLNGSEVKNKEQRLAEMRFLRGHYYFNLKIIYNQIPWIDETLVDPNEYNKKSNIEFSSDQLWEKILEEFSAAYKVLPESQADYGRPTKMAARAYMAKVYLYQSKWKECLEACDEVIQSGKYELFPDFRNVFLPENDNCSEIIFAIQLSTRCCGLRTAAICCCAAPPDIAPPRHTCLFGISGNTERIRPSAKERTFTFPSYSSCPATMPTIHTRQRMSRCPLLRRSRCCPPCPEMAGCRRSPCRMPVGSAAAISLR